MARNKVVQVACAPNLYADLTLYRKEKGLSSDAEAMRELVLIGLSNVDSSGSDNQPSNRELLESILYHVIKENKVSSGNETLCREELDLLLTNKAQ